MWCPLIFWPNPALFGLGFWSIIASYMKSENMKAIRVAYRRKKSMQAWRMVRIMLTEQTEAISAQRPNSHSKWFQHERTAHPTCIDNERSGLMKVPTSSHTRTLDQISWTKELLTLTRDMFLTNHQSWNWPSGIFGSFLFIHGVFLSFDRLPHEAVPSSPIRPWGWSIFSQSDVDDAKVCRSS